MDTRPVHTVSFLKTYVYLLHIPSLPKYHQPDIPAGGRVIKVHSRYITGRNAFPWPHGVGDLPGIKWAIRQSAVPPISPINLVSGFIWQVDLFQSVNHHWFTAAGHLHQEDFQGVLGGVSLKIILADDEYLYRREGVRLSPLPSG